ncbi:MAG: hypothetical protein H6636_14405, partial [Anaerolineales bacterium]|nr:hypothetical protein [Anaerolineales bacterium]
TKHETIGLVEIATTKKDFLFDPQILPICQEILVDRGARLITPLSANDPQTLFSIEEKLLEVTGGEVCSFSEWDRLGNRIFNLAVITNIVWPVGQGIRFNPDLETWRQAFDQGNTISFIRSEDKETRAMVYDGTEVMDVDSLIVFPLQKGHERIGVIELYDFNHRRVVTSEQITLLRTIADKASYSIENARLLQLTQNKLDEQITLLHEKEVLLKEIHHRVKNNLQIISSLLNLQSNYVKDPGSLRALHDSQARVRSMALIHEKLYQSNSLAKIDFGEYVQSLAKDLFRSYQRSLGEIELKVEAAEIALDLDYAIPCGLILNELLTNALKYAFPKGRKGQLWIELTILPDQRVCLKVADNGIGLPEGFDLTKSSSLGLQLVRNLVSQIEGKLELQRSGGTAFLISFRY